MDKKLNITKYLDSTYLKNSSEAGITNADNKEIIISIINEAILSEFACVMIRPEFVRLAKEMIDSNNSKLKIGTVIDFPFGSSSADQKITEAYDALIDGAYDIDYVCDYNAFKRGSFEKFDHDIVIGTKIIKAKDCIVKWIIETGALSRQEIRDISIRIVRIVQLHFSDYSDKVFIKTSTGYYGGYGATVKDVKTIASVSGNLKIKASGGVSNLSTCLALIEAGAHRIGTSKAQLIFKQQKDEF